MHLTAVGHASDRGVGKVHLTGEGSACDSGVACSVFFGGGLFPRVFWFFSGSSLVSLAFLVIFNAFLVLCQQTGEGVRLRWGGTHPLGRGEGVDRGSTSPA